MCGVPQAKQIGSEVGMWSKSDQPDEMGSLVEIENFPLRGFLLWRVLLLDKITPLF